MNKHVYIYSSNTKEADTRCWDNNQEKLARLLADSHMTHIFIMIFSIQCLRHSLRRSRAWQGGAAVTDCILSVAKGQLTRV